MAANICKSRPARLTTVRLVLTTFVLPLVGLTSAMAAERWYSPGQVERGRVVFQEHCASCHGAQAQGLVKDWQKTGEDGKYPPPPLNGTAHAWHHSLEVLRRTIREGNAKLGGQMQAFGDRIDGKDMDAAIAYFQSFWSDDTYETWLKNSGQVEEGKKQVKQRATGEDTEKVTARLAARLPGAKLGQPKKVPIGELYEVKAGSQYLYVSGDGTYALLGDLINLTTGENLTEKQRGGDRLELLKVFPDTDKVIFPAQGKEHGALDIFTDTSCPYCRKLHAEVPRLRNAGVTVRYLPFPRGGAQGPGYADLKAVWCAEDRLEAMNIAKETSKGALGDGACEKAKAVDRGYLLGQRIGITGTPAIILPDGRLQPGYLPAKQLIELLGAGRTK